MNGLNNKFQDLLLTNILIIYTRVVTLREELNLDEYESTQRYYNLSLQ